MPTRDTSWPAGTPCWIDYPAADVDAAKAFYTAVVGFDYSEGRGEFGGYFNCLTGGRRAAGMMPMMEPGMVSAWTTYFSTDDAAATAEKINAAGGTVLAGPHEVGTLGTMVIALDPQGAQFGAWQPADHLGVEVYNEPGALCWNEASMADPEVARTFYTAVFGYSWDEIPESGGYTTFSTGGDPLGGLGGQQPGGTEGWQACFAVPSAEDAVAAVEANGGKVIAPPFDIPFGRFAVVEDPWGASFEVIRLNEG